MDTFPLIRGLFSQRAELEILGKAIGFDEPIHESRLAYHQQRVNVQPAILSGISITLAALGIIPVFVLFNVLPRDLFSLLLAFWSLYIFVFTAIAWRISNLVQLRYFSDSVCIQTLILLIMDLARSENPLTTLQKKQLLGRTTRLAKATRSLSSQYNLDTQTLNWAKKHLRQIEFFIQEREKWIVAPKDSTLEDLQQDFYHLARIFISGNLGDFEYDTEVNTTDETSNTSTRDFLIGMLRSTIAIILPVAGLLIISLKPALIAEIIDAQVLALICIGWLLLAIDAILKLGIVKSLVEIAKGIKDIAS